MKVKLIAGDCASVTPKMEDNSVDFVFFSPFYPEARTYGLGENCILGDKWPQYIVNRMVQLCRISRGFVAINCSDKVEDGVYKGRPERLFCLMSDLGYAVVRPYVWAKQGEDFDDRGNGTPGSGGKRFHRNDYEMVYVFAAKEKFEGAYTNPLAFGLPPKFPAGGSTTHRNVDGERKSDGKEYKPPKISNPGNIIRARGEIWYNESMRFIEVVNYGYACKESPAETLRSLRKAISEEEICEWYAGRRARLQTTAVLRSKLHGACKKNSELIAMRFLQSRFSTEAWKNNILLSSLRVECGYEGFADGSCNQGGTGTSGEDNESGEMQPLRNDGEFGSSSHRRKPIEQRSKESRSSLHDLSREPSQPADSGESTLLNLWLSSGKELQEIWDTVRQTLPTLQKARLTVGGQGSGSGWYGFGEASDVIRARVGGGHLGHEKAHKNEAPMPLALAERFICWYTPPGGTVLDPYCGSGTTLHAAHMHGFNSIGIDYRESQCKTAKERLSSVGAEVEIEYTDKYLKLHTLADV